MKIVATLSILRAYDFPWSSGSWLFPKKFLRLPIFHKTMNCTQNRAYSKVEHWARGVPILFLRRAHGSSLDCKVSK